MAPSWPWRVALESTKLTIQASFMKISEIKPQMDADLRRWEKRRDYRVAGWHELTQFQLLSLFHLRLSASICGS